MSPVGAWHESPPPVWNGSALERQSGRDPELGSWVDPTTGFLTTGHRDRDSACGRHDMRTGSRWLAARQSAIRRE